MLGGTTISPLIALAAKKEAGLKMLHKLMHLQTGICWDRARYLTVQRLTLGANMNLVLKKRPPEFHFKHAHRSTTMRVISRYLRLHP